jgi:Ser/Thr protein kinase RdoA (MazF antagonist)
MRIKLLPPNPNLDHLKQQAKDLLASLREDDSSASLADAQRALANEYDFRTWPELKAEVERRRTIVEHPDPALVRELSAQFALGEPLGSGCIVAYEFQGPLVRFQTESGDWMAHQVFAWVDDVHVERTLPLLEAARALGVATPRPVQGADGRWVGRVADNSWRLDEWFERGPSLSKPARSATVRQIGELIGTLHSLGLEPHGKPVPWLTKRRSDAEWSDVLTMVKEFDVSWSPLLADALPSVIELNDVAGDPADDELILSHTNLGGDSVRVGPNGSMLVVEWDFAGPTTRAWEFGAGLCAWCLVDGKISEPRVRAFVEGYRSAHGDLPSAPGLSMFASTISAWSNQLASRMGAATWGSNDPAERTRATKEVEHTLAAPLSVALLEDLLEAIS